MSEHESEKTGFGASLLPSSPPKAYRSNIAKPSMESMFSSLAPSSSPQSPMQDEFDPTASAKPCSPFYSHPRTRTSVEQAKSESQIAINMYEHDLESGSRVLSPQISHQIPHSLNAEQCPRLDECTMWPCKNEQIKKDEVRRRQRSRCCGPLANLSKTQKLWMQILVALVIVGAAVGLGIGIARATHTGIYKTQNTQTPIGNN